MTRSKMVSMALAGVLFAAMAWLPPLAADEPPEDPQHIHDEDNVWAIARGGRLYDNWMAELLHDLPRDNHPAYPEVGRKRGNPTWRCKECHGWDYNGVEGEYRKGSNHYTGIKGVRGVIGMDIEEIHAIIMNDIHRYTENQLPHAAQELLAMFLSKGQVDMDKYIDVDSKKARGDVKRGGQLYQTLCVICHGYDGREINFKSEKYPSYVGTICNRNPWESLHKIRFGQPAVGMVALANQDIETVVDLLAYCQTLPEK